MNTACAVIVTRRRRESNPRTGLCRPLPKPLGHAAVDAGGAGPALHRRCRRCLRADDGIRTRDPHLGKVMRYQLRYVRMVNGLTTVPPPGDDSIRSPKGLPNPAISGAS